MEKPQNRWKNRISGSHLFLMELILSLLLFSVAAAASVSVFVKAHQMSQEASDLTEADADLSSVAELIRSSDTGDDLRETAAKAYPDSVFEDSASGAVLRIGFLKGGASAPVEDADYIVTATYDVANLILHADLSCTDQSGSEIASLSVDHVLVVGMGGSS